MKRNYCLAALIILMIVANEPTALAVGEKPVDLSGLHKPTFYPYPMNSPSGRTTAMLDTPVAQSFVPSGSQENNQALVQVRFRIVGELNQPLPGAQFSGRDAANNAIQGITDDNGYVTIVGAPGNWQFLIYVSGYFSDALIYPFTSSTTRVLQLQQIGKREEIDLSNHERTRDILPTIKITMPAFCSNATENSNDLTIDQPTYTGDEG